MRGCGKQLLLVRSRVVLNVAYIERQLRCLAGLAVRREFAADGALVAQCLSHWLCAGACSRTCVTTSRMSCQLLVREGRAGGARSCTLHADAALCRDCKQLRSLAKRAGHNFRELQNAYSARSMRPDMSVADMKKCILRALYGGCGARGAEGSAASKVARAARSDRRARRSES